ncbi:MAG: NF038143 family protein [Deltaproteobacteria bacterium]|nr:NF038143 family protein [Deltaproteobacteria bacterium]
MLSLNDKYECILSHEVHWAKKVSQAVLKPRAVSVWEVLVPVLLVFSHVRWKASREVFEKNLLFTKRLALDSAMDLTGGQRTRKQVISNIFEKTSSLLAPDNQGIYSEEIRARQLEEIELLMEHYCRLLSADGDDYPSLLINAYGCVARYREFLERIKAAEKAVNLAALHTLGGRADRELLSRIEKLSHEVRECFARRIFQGAC